VGTRATLDTGEELHLFSHAMNWTIYFYSNTSEMHQFLKFILFCSSYEMAGFVFGDNLFSMRSYGASSFAGSMWFMPLFSIYVVSFGPLEVDYKVTRVFDSGWIEYFGGQGSYWVF